MEMLTFMMRKKKKERRIGEGVWQVVGRTEARVGVTVEAVEAVEVGGVNKFV